MKACALEVDMMSRCSTPIARVLVLHEEAVHVIPTKLPLGPWYTPVL